jgi:prepilin-type N-terminal cleavage/methylation domain-containing protein
VLVAPHRYVDAGVLTMARTGFTLIEVTIALVLLAVGILAVSASSARMSQASAVARSEATALQAANDRLSVVLMHPDYASLDSVFTSTESNVPAAGFSRETAIVRTITDGVGGRKIDYTDITVTVTGPGMAAPLTRTQTVGAP